MPVQTLSFVRRVITSAALSAAVAVGFISLSGCGSDPVEGPVEQSEDLDPLPADY